MATAAHGSLTLARQLARLTLRAPTSHAGPSTSSVGRAAYSTSATSSRHRLGRTALKVGDVAIRQQPVAARGFSSSSAKLIGAGAANIDPSSYESIGLGNLRPAQRRKKSKRLGRGDSSGRGGTSTRGHKGQKARAGNGKPVPGFTGGQTPIQRQFPKRGFTNIFAKDYASVSMTKLQEWIDAGRLDTSQPITAYELFQSKCVHHYKDGIKLLGTGADSLVTPVNIVVSKATPLAIAAIEGAGGTVVCKYYTPASLLALVKPHKLAGRVPPRDPDPVSKKDLLYYADAANRGYLSIRTPTERPVQSAKYLAAVAAEAAKAEGQKDRPAAGP